MSHFLSITDRLFQEVAIKLSSYGILWPNVNTQFRYIVDTSVLPDIVYNLRY